MPRPNAADPNSESGWPSAAVVTAAGLTGTDGESGYQDISVALPESTVSSSGLRLYRIFFMLV
jgi:hypothetical protein